MRSNLLRTEKYRSLRVSVREESWRSVCPTPARGLMRSCARNVLNHLGRPARNSLERGSGLRFVWRSHERTVRSLNTAGDIPADHPLRCYCLPLLSAKTQTLTAESLRKLQFRQTLRF